HAAMWSRAAALARANPDPLRTLLLPALNEVIDLHEKRLTAMRNHVPTIILVLLLMVSVLTMASLGHAAGVSGGRSMSTAAAVAWAAESYESDLNVWRPAVLAAAAPAPPRPRAGPSRLVWVLVDGLRLDASRRMPVLNRLRADGLDVVARAEFPSFSGPQFIAQASGIEPAASGVLSNGFPREVE